MSRPGLRAGILGGVAAAVVSTLSLVPICGCLSLLLVLAVFVGTGVLAAAWMAPPRQSGAAAGEGAIAGLIAGAISGLASMVLVPISFSLAGGTAAVMSQLPPEALDAFRQSGMDPNTFVSGSIFGTGALCCGASIVLALALSALGGLIFAAVKPE